MIYLPLEIFQGFCHLKTAEVDVVRLPVDRDGHFYWTVSSPEISIPSGTHLEIASKEFSLGFSVDNIRVNITLRGQYSNTSDQETRDDGKGFARHLQKYRSRHCALAMIVAESIETDAAVIVNHTLTDTPLLVYNTRALIDVHQESSMDACHHLNQDSRFDNDRKTELIVDRYHMIVCEHRHLSEDQ